MNESTLPLVSICIPAYNAARFIEATVRSAVQQTYPNIEVIVSDDASIDDTARIVTRSAPAKVSLLRQPRNLGMCANWNAAVKSSSGKYVVKLDADDILEPTYVSSMVPTFEQRHDVAFGHCACRLIDEDGNEIGYERSISGSFVRDGLAEWPRYVFGPRAVNIVMLRRSEFDAVGGYDPAFQYSGDWAMHRALLRRGSVFYNDELLASYRVHPIGGRGLELLQARERLMHLERIAADWPKEIPDRDRLLTAARNHHAKIVLRSAAFVAEPQRREIVRITRSYGAGKSARLLAVLVSHGGAPLVRYGERVRLWLRQRVKKLLYGWR